MREKKLVDILQPPNKTNEIKTNDDFDFIGSDSFNPQFDSSGASTLWYKAGQTNSY